MVYIKSHNESPIWALYAAERSYTTTEPERREIMANTNTNVIASVGGFSKRDVLNSKNGIPMKDFDGDSMMIPNVVKGAIAEATDEETGEIKYISVLVTDDQTYFTSISGTIYDSMPDVLDILEDEQKINVRINKRVSKGNKRDFLTITVL